MIPATLRDRLASGGETIGLSINFRSAHLVEMAAQAGFDFVSFDAEHGPLDLADLEAMLLAADAHGLPAISRPPNARPDTILRFMDLGLCGVMVPYVQSKDDAAAMVDAVRYPPAGRRGLGYVRANDWGLIPSAEYVAAANANAVTIGLIETAQAVERIDEILDVPGLDVVWIGPVDLAQSMDLLAEPNHSRLRASIERVASRSRAAGRAVGIGVGSARAMDEYRSVGVNWFAVTARSLFFGAATSFLADAKSPRREVT